MAKKRVYVDTSVVGGNFDREFEKLTVPFWDAVCDGKIIAVLSDVLADELSFPQSKYASFVNHCHYNRLSVWHYQRKLKTSLTSTLRNVLSVKQVWWIVGTLPLLQSIKRIFW